MTTVTLMQLVQWGLVVLAVVIFLTVGYLLLKWLSGGIIFIFKLIIAVIRLPFDALIRLVKGL